MKNVNFLSILIFGSLVTILQAQVPPPDNHPRPLVIYFDSYTPDMKWVQGIQSEINKTFFKKYEGGKLVDDPKPKYDFRAEHLNAKYYSDAPYFASLMEIMRKRYVNVNTPGRRIVLIASDDFAVSFLMRYREKIFPGINPPPPILFCGVNDQAVNFPALTGPEGVALEEKKTWQFADLPAQRASGFREKPGFEITLRLIKAIHPDCREVLVVNDDLETTGKAWTSFIKSEEARMRSSPEYADLFSGPLQITHFTDSQDKTLRGLHQKVRDLTQNNGVVLLGAYFSDPQRTVESYELTTEEICKNAYTDPAVPVYGMLGFHVTHGARGGFALSGESEGREMARLAKEIIEDPAYFTLPPTSLPTVKEKAGHPMPTFDYKNFHGDSKALKAAKNFILSERTPAGERLFPQQLYKYGIAATPSEWVKLTMKAIGKSPWFYGVIALAIWWAVLIIGGKKFPMKILKVYLFLEDQTALKENHTKLEKYLGWSYYLILSLFVLPTLMIRPWLAAAWIRENRQNGVALLRRNPKIRKALTPEPLDVPFIIDSGGGNRSQRVFRPQLFERRFRRKQAHYLIQGRGGSGKSTLAYQIADHCVRGSIGGIGAVPVVLTGAHRDITADEANEQIINATRASVTLYAGSEGNLPDSWIRYLARKGYLLFIGDGISEMPRDYSDTLIGMIGNAEIPFNRVIITSRTEQENFSGVRIEMGLLMGDSLVRFVEGYLTRQTRFAEPDFQGQVKRFLAQKWNAAYPSAPPITADGVSEAVISELGVRISNEYFGTYVDCRATPFFVVLRLDSAASQRAHETLVEVATNCIYNLYARISQDGSQKIATSGEALKMFYTLAWSVLWREERFLSDVFNRAELDEFLREVSQEEIDEFLTSLGVVEPVGTEQNVFRFINDPLAEYLSPLGWQELDDSEKKRAWERLSERADEVIASNQIFELRGVIISFYSFWWHQDPRFKADFPWTIPLDAFQIREPLQEEGGGAVNLAKS